MPARQAPHGPPGAVPRPSAHLIARSGARDPSMTRNRPDAVNEQRPGVELLNGASGSPEQRVSIRVFRGSRPACCGPVGAVLIRGRTDRYFHVMWARPLGLAPPGRGGPTPGQAHSRRCLLKRTTSNRHDVAKWSPSKPSWVSPNTVSTPNYDG